MERLDHTLTLRGMEGERGCGELLARADGIRAVIELREARALCSLFSARASPMVLITTSGGSKAVPLLPSVLGAQA